MPAPRPSQGLSVSLMTGNLPAGPRRQAPCRNGHGGNRFRPRTHNERHPVLRLRLAGHHTTLTDAAPVPYRWGVLQMADAGCLWLSRLGGRTGGEVRWDVKTHHDRRRDVIRGPCSPLGCPVWSGPVLPQLWAGSVAAVSPGLSIVVPRRNEERAGAALGAVLAAAPARRACGRLSVDFRSTEWTGCQCPGPAAPDAQIRVPGHPVCAGPSPALRPFVPGARKPRGAAFDQDRRHRQNPPKTPPRRRAFLAGPDADAACRPVAGPSRGSHQPCRRGPARVPGTPRPGTQKDRGLS